MATYLFDLDGTLISSGGAGRRALDRAFLEVYDVSGAMAPLSPAGMTDPVIVVDLFRLHLERTPRDGEMARLLGLYLGYLPEELERASRFRLLPGVPAVTRQLKALGHDVGLATGNVREGARIKLEHAGIWEEFSFGGFADDSHLRAELVRVAAERAPNAAGPGDTFVVGDTPRDVAAARACGFRAIAVATGPHSADELDRAGADRVIATLEALLP